MKNADEEAREVILLRLGANYAPTTKINPHSMTVGALLTLREAKADVATAHTLSLRDNGAHAPHTCAARIRHRSKRRKRAIRVSAVYEWKI